MALSTLSLPKIINILYLRATHIVKSVQIGLFRRGRSWAEALDAGMAQMVLVTEWTVLIFRHYNESIFKCNIGPDFEILLLCVCRHHNNFVFQMTVELFYWWFLKTEIYAHSKGQKFFFWLWLLNIHPVDCADCSHQFGCVSLFM